MCIALSISSRLACRHRHHVGSKINEHSAAKADCATISIPEIRCDGMAGKLYQLEDHWVTGASRIPSPNCSDRPPGSDIQLLVIHNISLPPGEFGTGCIDELFCNSLNPDAHPFFATISELRVSAHLLIERDGALRQYVSFAQQAWHAGKSSFQGRDRCNEYSIGIELEGTDDTAFTAPQYATLAAISALLLQHYPGLSEDRIVGHSDIAPGRKTDPGPCFDWAHYKATLAQRLRTESE